MKTFTIDSHHVVLYGVIAVVSACGLGVLHSWRMDLSAAKTKSEADERIIADRDRSEAERAKQYEAQLELIHKMRVTAKTPAPVIISRLQGLEPSMSVLPDQLVAPKPDAPKVNLSLDPAQQVTLVNRLVDCKECDTERAKLRGDVVDEQTKRKAAEDAAAAWKTAAKGGSLWQRFKRRAQHLGEDAVILELIRCAVGHC